MLGLVLLNLHRLGLYQFSWVFFFTITLLFYACLKTRCCWQGNEFVFEQYKASFYLWCHGSNNLVDDVGCSFYCIPSFLIHMIILKNLPSLWDTWYLKRSSLFVSLSSVSVLMLSISSPFHCFAIGECRQSFCARCYIPVKLWIFIKYLNSSKRSRHPTV